MGKAKKSTRKSTRKSTPKRGRPKGGNKNWEPRFIQELARTGNVYEACLEAGVDRSRVYEKRKADAIFANLWIEAEAISLEALRAEIRRRAVEGVDRPVYQGGEMVGKVRMYSDTLLMFLAKARDPKTFGDSSRVTVAGDATAPVKHEHRISVTDRIEQLARLFGGDPTAVPGATSGGGVGDGPREPVDPGEDQAGPGREGPDE